MLTAEDVKSQKLTGTFRYYPTGYWEDGHRYVTVYADNGNLMVEFEPKHNTQIIDKLPETARFVKG